MIELKRKSDCTGCGVCSVVCPTDAIALIPDEEGFLYPNIASNLCIQCGICEKKCPILEKKRIKDGEPRKTYAARTKNEKILNNSSSGGIFTEIATYVIERNGVVFGASLSATMEVKHICVDTIFDLEKLRGSKYVQSEIGSTFLEAKQYLEAGRLVLFTGTPCQIAGLCGFLNKKYDNLITQDIICHGVPSPAVWKKYVEFREIEANARTERVCFRNKNSGWRNYSLQFQFSNGTEYIKTLSNDLYMQCFLQNLSLRPSCYQCAFKSRQRLSDFTLGDFWGVEKICPEMSNDEGTSVVIIHTEKASELFNNIQQKLVLQEVVFEEAIQNNAAMIKSVAANKKRTSFFNEVAQSGFTNVRRFVRGSFRTRVKKRIKKVLKKYISKE